MIAWFATSKRRQYESVSPPQLSEVQMLHSDINRTLGAIDIALQYDDDQALRIHSRSLVDRTARLCLEVTDG